ncbi:transcriptional regulator [Halostagnicola larsenii XH-48]|uniref:Transcriptional regulator n=1 Tax=Halostagnicola larsenii XH-48 TaxID=797299 RepID=W0JPL3_9EURY|nr:hypothetical protein [Halostagnicola larsenii]AHF99114.1 transcriptional regulator [Halostagnicola larsenii XH-48]
MDSRTQERVERWDSRPFTGGYNELSTLADTDFSGVVTASGTWLFMLNGRVVGVVDGEIMAFERASGTIYAAPHDSLPLLCSMQAQGGETRASYYTNETPLSEVDQTLKDGSFTGYIELSEQVLSGDYYAVYYGGRRMAAAYIGNAQRLLTGEEAFERAADEVGIYEVVDVEIDVTDVPESSGQSASPSSSSEETAPASADSPSSTDEESNAVTMDSTSTAENTDETTSADEPSSNTGTEPPAGSSSTAQSQETARPASASELREVSDLTDIDDESDSTASSSSQSSDGEPSSDETGSATVSYTDESTDEAADDDGTGDSSVTETVAERPESSAEQDDQQPTRIESAETPSQEEPADAAETPSESTANSAGPSLEDEGDVQEDAGADQSDQTAQSPEAPPHEEPAESDDESTDSEEEGELDARLKQEERWRETRSIPSIDPEKSEHVGAVQRQSTDSGTDERRERRAQSSETARADETTGGDPRQDHSRTDTAAASNADGTEQESTGDSPSNAAESVRSRPDGTSPETTVDEYEQRIETLTQHARELESRRETLEAENAELESERDRLRAENQELSATVEQLNARITELETACERLRNADAIDAEAGTAGFGDTKADQQLSPREALSGTNLFVRYASKSDPTLQTAHDGADERDAVASNLQIEQHTTFDSSNVAVAGRSYEDFLADTMEYQFVDWLVQTLLFEIRDTGHGDALADLYDAIPRIDRAELQASISLEDDETDDVPEEVTFDVVAFDKMGNPLVVANCNDSRDPASEEMLAALEEAASAVTANYPDLGAAMVVTASYFEPGALEVTEQATSSGFLSRGSKLSYVNLSRKQGYHLALVESRSSGFHMNVPEL